MCCEEDYVCGKNSPRPSFPTGPLNDWPYGGGWNISSTLGVEENGGGGILSMGLQWAGQTILSAH